MRLFVLVSMTAALLSAASLPVSQSRFAVEGEGRPAGWTVWSARPEIAPRTFVDMIHSRGEAGSLAISGNSNPAAYGGWEHTVQDVRPGQWYRFTAYYRADAVPYEALNVVARLDWRRPDGRRAGQPNYAYDLRAEGEWQRLTLDARAPERASAVTLQLYLANAPQGTVWWDDVRLEPVAAPVARNVTVAAINLRPRNTKAAAESVRQFIETVQKTVTKADIILLPEGITIVGTGKTYADVAEPIPGPTTDTLAQVARDKNAWVVAGIIEREGTTLYNTAVLLDRAGRVAGKYRKVYLPREEIEGGITPGSSYPVFQTDFGKIGMMICWDVQYADPARNLALKGAELILMPIWGGNTLLGKARSVEYRVFLASSGYDYPTAVQDPDGETMAVATANGSAAITTIDLNRRYVDSWLGDMRERMMRELRLDVPVERPGLGR